eukprot:5389087-Amphidinium_carterae.1
MPTQTLQQGCMQTFGNERVWVASMGDMGAARGVGMRKLSDAIWQDLGVSNCPGHMDIILSSSIWLNPESCSFAFVVRVSESSSFGSESAADPCKVESFWSTWAQLPQPSELLTNRM